MVFSITPFFHSPFAVPQQIKTGEKIKNGKSIRYLTPDEVYFYIKENNLYNTK